MINKSRQQAFQRIRRLQSHTVISVKPAETLISSSIGNNSQVEPQVFPLENSQASKSLENVRPRRKSMEEIKQLVVGAVHTAKLFESAVRDPKPTVKCLVFSWYGYATLKMFEAQPRVCMDKVFFIIVGYAV